MNFGMMGLTIEMGFAIHTGANSPVVQIKRGTALLKKISMGD